MREPSRKILSTTFSRILYTIKLFLTIAINESLMPQPAIENALSYSPSCSIEDAVMYLLEFRQRDIQALWVQHSDDPSDGEWISGAGYLELADSLELAESELAEAKYDKASDKIIADKQAELDHCIALNMRAHSYKCAIVAELANDNPKLRVDKLAKTKLSYPYITLLSLKRWAHEVLQISILDELGTVKPVNRVPKLRAQENAILDAIKKLGHDPKNFPKNLPGKPGAKKNV